MSFSVNTYPVLFFLDAIDRFSKTSRFFYASSSLIYGLSTNGVCDEDSPIVPDTPYAISKHNAMLIINQYRQHKIMACAGILFNHESEFRSDLFLSKKIISAAIQIKNGLKNELILGDLEALIDWGYAGDYVRAMQQILRVAPIGDYVIATGKLRSVREFVNLAFCEAGLDYTKFVKQDTFNLYRRRGVICGSYKKINNVCGWQPHTPFETMIKNLVWAEDSKVSRMKLEGFSI